MLNPVCPKRSPSESDWENWRMEKTNHPNRILKIALGWEKSAILPIWPEKNTRRKTLMNTLRADVFWMAFDKAWISSGRNAIDEWGHTSYLLQRAAALELCQCGGWALGFAVFTFDFLNPPSMKKANPFLSLILLLPAEKSSSENGYIREFLETLRYFVRYGGGWILGWGFQSNLKIRARLFLFWIQDHKPFTIWCFRACT